MQRPKLTLLIPVLLASSLLFLSNSGNPPDGRTNAPFDGFCSDCHGGGTYDGIVDIAGLPATILPNTTYSITLTATATNGSPVRGGFQLVSVNSSNQNFGDLSNTSGETGTSMSGGREYIDQRGAKNFSGNTVSWSFNWTSPNGPSGSMVTMYFAANLTNGNGSTSGDRPISASKTATMTGGGNPLVASISSKKNVSCFGGNDGEATATATGGQPGYSYAWSNGQNGDLATGLAAGTYFVTVTDMVGATATASASISQPALLRHSVQILRHVSCPQGRDGAVTTTASGGIPPYSFIYSAGSPSNLSAGNYSVTVTDANFCTSSSTFDILQPDSFAVSTTILEHPDCPRDSNGQIQITVSGATSPYRYKWSNGESSSFIGNLGIGNYIVTITDAKNCTAVFSYALSSLDSIAPQLETRNGKIYLNAIGWAIPDLLSFIANRQDNCDNNPTLFWNLDTIRCSQTGKLNTLISARDYSGNVTQKSVEIEVFDTIKPIVQIWPDTSFYSCDIQVPNVQAFDACGLEYFRQLSGPLPGEIFPLGQSVLKFEAKDLSGNSHMDSFKVNVIHPVAVEIDSQYFDLCSGNQLFTRINLQHRAKQKYSLLHLQERYEFEQDTQITLTNVFPDSLIYSIIDLSGCSFTDTLEVRYPGPLFSLDSFLIKDETGSGKQDGQIELFHNGADSILFYEFPSGTLVNRSGNQLKAGDYLVRVYKDSCVYEYGPFTIKLLSKANNVPLRESIKVFPVPFANVLNLVLEGMSEPLSYQIFDSNGQLAISGKLPVSGQLDVRSLKPGVYYLRWSMTRGTGTKRLVKFDE